MSAMEYKGVTGDLAESKGISVKITESPFLEATDNILIGERDGGWRLW